MKRHPSIHDDERGAAVIEFALALPIMITMIYGIFQVGLLLEANAGMQHALGEAARHASIYPTPDDAAIKARVASRKFGAGNGTLSELSIADNKTGTVTLSKTLQLTYTHPTNFIFFPGPTVRLQQSKVVYVADPAAASS